MVRVNDPRILAGIRVQTRARLLTCQIRFRRMYGAAWTIKLVMGTVIDMKTDKFNGPRVTSVRANWKLSDDLKDATLRNSSRGLRYGYIGDIGFVRSLQNLADGLTKVMYEEQRRNVVYSGRPQVQPEQWIVKGEQHEKCVFTTTTSYYKRASKTQTHLQLEASHSYCQRTRAGSQYTSELQNSLQNQILCRCLHRKTQWSTRFPLGRNRRTSQMPLFHAPNASHVPSKRLSCIHFCCWGPRM